MNQSPILIIGASGTVGSQVARNLAVLGVPMRLASRVPTVHPPGPVEEVALDFARPETFAPALAGVKGLFLMLPPGLTPLETTLFALIDAAAAAGVERVAFLSILGADAVGLMPHARIEAHLRSSGLGWTFLRAANFMQNFATSLARDLVERDLVAVPAGHGATGFVDARDVAAVAVVALTQPGHIGQAYTLTGPEALTYGQCAAIMAAELERPIRYRPPSILGFVRHYTRLGFPLGMVLVMVMLFTLTRLHRSGRVTHDVERILGRPPTSFSAFVQDARSTWAVGAIATTR